MAGRDNRATLYTSYAIYLNSIRRIEGKHVASNCLKEIGRRLTVSIYREIDKTFGGGVKDWGAGVHLLMLFWPYTFCFVSTQDVFKVSFQHTGRNFGHNLQP